MSHTLQQLKGALLHRRVHVTGVRHEEAREVEPGRIALGLALQHRISDRLSCSQTLAGCRGGLRSLRGVHAGHDQAFALRLYA